MNHPAAARRLKITITLALALLAVIFAAGVCLGPAALPLPRVVQTVLGHGSAKEELILFSFRLPRMLITVMAGMGLAVSGAILQSMTRNPLADPGVLGINAGAGLMVTCFVMFFSVDASLVLYAIPLFSLCGGLAAGAFIYLLAFKKGQGADPTRLILIGIGLSAALYGASLTLGTRLDREAYLFIANWLAGRVWGDNWTFVVALLPWIAIGLPWIYAKSSQLNIMSLHEETAIGLGVNVRKQRMRLLLAAAALASTSVSVSGGIGFIGLMAPHLARMLVGVRHQAFLPVSALVGAVILLAADTVSRVWLGALGIPAGIIVTLLGAPYFMYLMVKE